MTFSVRYFVGGYCGTRVVYADDGEQAIAKVKAWARSQMTLPMYAERYRILTATEEPGRE